MAAALRAAETGSAVGGRTCPIPPNIAAEGAGGAPGGAGAPSWCGMSRAPEDAGVAALPGGGWRGAAGCFGLGSDGESDDGPLPKPLTIGRSGFGGAFAFALGFTIFNFMFPMERGVG